MKMKEFTIYGFMHPVKLCIYYVGLTGKSANARMSRHIDEAKSKHEYTTSACAINKQLLEIGLEPILITLDRIVTGDQRYAADLERYWINHAKFCGHPIENKRKLDPYQYNCSQHRNIKSIHESIDSGQTYESHNWKRRAPPMIIEPPFDLEEFGKGVSLAHSVAGEEL